MNWDDVRARLPAASRYTYLDTASAPPISIDAAEAGKRYYDEMLADGDVPWGRWLSEVEQVRESLARFIRARPDEVAFVPNASHGMNLAAQMVDPGSIVTMADEFPTSTLPWLRQGRRLHFVDSNAQGVIDPADVEQAIAPDTVAIVTSHVQFRTGFRCDLQALARVCARRGLVFIVDAAQSLGAMPIDVDASGVDVLVFSGYKWPLAGYGNGGLFLRRAFRESTTAPVAGWMSATEPDRHVNDRLDLRNTAAVVEVGCPNFAGIFALGASLNLLARLGIDRVASRIHELTDHLHRQLAAQGFEIASPIERGHRAGITIVAVDRAADIVDALTRRGVLVSARGRGIRVSVHIFNTPGDIDSFVGALRVIVDDVR